MPADYIVRGGGTIYTVTPQTDSAEAFLKESIDGEVQWFGKGLAVEHRYIENLVEGLMGDGFTFLFE